MENAWKQTFWQAFSENSSTLWSLLLKRTKKKQKSPFTRLTLHGLQVWRFPVAPRRFGSSASTCLPQMATRFHFSLRRRMENEGKQGEGREKSSIVIITIKLKHCNTIPITILTITYHNNDNSNRVQQQTQPWPSRAPGPKPRFLRGPARASESAFQGAEWIGGFLGHTLLTALSSQSKRQYFRTLNNLCYADCQPPSLLKPLPPLTTAPLFPDAWVSNLGLAWESGAPSLAFEKLRWNNSSLSLPPFK